MVGVSVENRFDFISLHGYSLRWQLKRWQQVLDEGTIWLTAKARETETVSIPTVQEASHLCMQVLRPDGSLCYEKSIKLNDATDYRQMLTESTLTSPLLPLPSSLFPLPSFGRTEGAFLAAHRPPPQRQPRLAA